MYIIYTIIAVIVIFIIISAIFRKRIYREVDRLEEWKNDIVNRPITDEIGKVKNLQMSGQTEEKFEEWRDEWDEIVGTTVPNIGEKLFDIEDLAAKNRFKKAKNLIESTDQRLSKIEKQLTRMTGEINQLVESAEKNRTEIDEVKERFKTVSAELAKRRGLLGSSLEAFDKQIADIDFRLQQFDQATLEGSYLTARENLVEASDQIEETTHLLNQYPKLLVLIETTIPSEIEGLQEGMEEMEKSGYSIESFGILARIEAFQEELVHIKEEVELLHCEQAEERLENLSEEIEQLYELLENEVQAKHYVSTELPKLHTQVDELDHEIHALLTETVQVQQSYHIPSQLQKAQGDMRDTALDLTRQLAVLNDITDHNKQTFTSIREMIMDWQESVAKLKISVQKDKESLYTLREEEWKAKETLQHLRDQLLETKRIVQKSNIPGLPVDCLEQLEQAEKKLQEATKQIEQVPLEIGRITVLVNEASDSVQENEELVKKTVALAEKAERVIQFGNRYRSRSQTVAAGLSEAEQYFRDCEYEAAIDRAVQVIESYAPNVLELVDEFNKVVN